MIEKYAETIILTSKPLIKIQNIAKKSPLITNREIDTHPCHCKDMVRIDES